MARLLRAWVRPLVAVAVLAGGAAGLCGCSGESEPSVSVTPTVTDGGVLSPSPSPSPSPTVLPELTEQELLELLPEGTLSEDLIAAKEFAAFFLAEFRRMYQERDSRLFEALCDPASEFCASSLENFDTLIASGDTTSGGDVIADATSATGALSADENLWYVSISFIVTPAEVHDRDGVVTNSRPESAGTADVALRWDSSHWTVVGVAVAET